MPSKRMKYTNICEQCGEIYHPWRREQVFCGFICKGLAMKGGPRRGGGTPRGSEEAKQTSKTMLKGKTERKDGRTMGWGNLSNIFRGAHDYICKRCGYKGQLCKSDIVVHHRDGNKKNDHPSNLICLCRNCHKLAHENNLSITHERS